MNTSTTALALTVRPKWFDLRNKAEGKSIRWVANCRGFELTLNHIDKTVSTELEAWASAVAHYPNLLTELHNAEGIVSRAYGLRGEMMLSLGPDRLAELEQNVHTEILGIHAAAMRILDATKVSKALPKVLRVSNASPISWLEVRNKIVTPYLRTPTMCGIRCLPSSLDDHTWSVRTRIAMGSASGVAEVQRRFDVLVAELSTQGITVKDTQNGTYLDL